MADNDGKGLTPAEERVKAYLDRLAEEDGALAALYAPGMIKECVKYVTDQARKKATSGCYCADDAEVWKWARDFYIEELPKKAEKIPTEVAARVPAGEKSGADDGGQEKTEEVSSDGETDEEEVSAGTDEESGDGELLDEGETRSEDGESSGSPAEDGATAETAACDGMQPLFDESGNGLLFPLQEE